MHVQTRSVFWGVLLLFGCSGSGHRAALQDSARIMERTTLRTAIPFDSVYERASLDRELLPSLRVLSAEVDVRIFFGTWCNDSKREVPRFMKLADSIGIPEGHIVMYALDRSWEKGLAQTMAVVRTPTFIFSKNGQEIGRIEERPRGTFESDLFSLLAKAH